MLDPIPDKNGHKFNDDQRRKYLNLTDQVGMKWLEVFEGDTEFYSAAYWDLLTGLWRTDGPRRKTDARGLMKGIKSVHAAVSILQRSGQEVEALGPVPKDS